MGIDSAEDREGFRRRGQEMIEITSNVERAARRIGKVPGRPRTFSSARTAMP
jgi:hypothetical protein